MKPRVLLLYEYGEPGLPYGSAYIRLLMPFSHRAVTDLYDVSPLPVAPRASYAVAVIDRSWRPDITPGLAAQTVTALRQSGARVIHHLDDNLMDLPTQDPAFSNYKAAVKVFSEQADLVMCSTPVLAERLREFNPNVMVVPNALDDRLLPRYPSTLRRQDADAPLVLGYMGTHTHDDDLLLILPALAEVARWSPQPLLLQIVGGVAHDATARALRHLPLEVQFIQPPVEQYPMFVNWFWHAIAWDVALAPLQDTPFNRYKSDLKYLDYAAMGVPGVYSDLPVYASVLDGETGLRVANEPDAWRNALQQMIAQPDLRRTLAANAYAYLHRERTLATQIGRWLSLLETA